MSAVGNYGKSLFELAMENNIENIILDDLKGITDLFNKNHDYVKILDSPQIERNELMKILNEDFMGEIHRYTLNFLKILCEKHMVHDFSKCAEEYEKLYNKAKNISIVNITTARELSDGIANKLEEKLKSRLGGKIVLKKRVDKSCIGGIIIEFDGKRIDSSLKTELANIRQSLVK